MAYLGQDAATKVAKQASVTTAVSDLDAVIERAGQYAVRLQQLHDRVHGAQPQEARLKDNDTPPHSVISAIHQRRNRLVDILDGMERAINGLENGI